LTPGNHPERSSGVRTAHQMNFLELGALPTAVSCTRAHAVAVVHEWGLAPLADDAEIIVADSLNLSICSIGLF
jgi:hypothetical protein